MGTAICTSIYASSPQRRNSRHSLPDESIIRGKASSPASSTLHVNNEHHPLPLLVPAYTYLSAATITQQFTTIQGSAGTSEHIKLPTHPHPLSGRWPTDRAPTTLRTSTTTGSHASMQSSRCQMGRSLTLAMGLKALRSSTARATVHTIIAKVPTW